MKRALLLISAVLAAAGPGACRDNPPVVYPTVAPVEESQLPLGPRDKLELTIFYGSRESKATYTLNDLGTIEVQYIGSVEAGGKTVDQIKTEVEKRLADGYINNPIVSLSVVEINSLKLSVLGQVMRSGNIRFKPKMLITEAIAEVGGFTPMARKNMVRVTRLRRGPQGDLQDPGRADLRGRAAELPDPARRRGLRPRARLVTGAAARSDRDRRGVAAVGVAVLAVGGALRPAQAAVAALVAARARRAAVVAAPARARLAAGRARSGSPRG